MQKVKWKMQHQKRWPLLHRAAMNHDGKRCIDLLRSGADPNELNADGMTPIECALAGCWKAVDPWDGEEVVAAMTTATIITCFGGEVSIDSGAKPTLLALGTRHELIPWLDAHLDLHDQLASSKAVLMAHRLDAATPAAASSAINRSRL